MSKERSLQSMPIVIGPCCSQKLKRRILATFDFNRTMLRATALRLIMRSSKTGRKTSSVASAVWDVLLKINVANILLFKFCEQKFVQHGPTMIAIDCNGFSLLIFLEICPNYASGTKSAPNSDSFWVRRFFNVWVRIFCVPNAIILLVYIAANIKMSLIWKHDIFFCQNRHLL